jgi:hypothetical protein
MAIACGLTWTLSGQLHMAAFGRLTDIFAMALAVAYSISATKLSKVPSVVRLGADNRHVAGQ